jgi:PAS domain S-box-containing protein
VRTRTHVERLSIRTRIVLLVLTIALPVAGVLAWLLADDLQETREAADATVGLLATGTAADLEREIAHWQGVLARLAQRPLVSALDPARCDPVMAELPLLGPEFAGLVSRDLSSNAVCSSLARPAPRLDPRKFPWFEEALRAGRPYISGGILGPATGRWVIALSQPLRDGAGAQTGMLVLSIDLIRLNRQLLGATPPDATVSVVDRDRTLLLRSIDLERYIGKRPDPGEPDVLQGRREGFQSATGRDGVQRLVGFVTMPGTGWRVVAGLPEAEVYAVYRNTLRRTVAVALGLLLATLALAWRLNTVIAGPITALAEAASKVGGGDTEVRARIVGPVEIAAVAEQFNRMLDARDAAEAALRESEQRYRTLVDWSPEAISVHRDGKVLFVNPACVELLGAASAQDLVGTPSIDAVHPDFRPDTQKQVDDIIATRQAGAMREVTFLRRDGAHVDVEVRGLPVVFNGEPALFASMRDITARKKTEIALSTSEARLSAIFDSATVGILTVDEDQIIMQANPAVATIFGCPVDALIGAPLAQLIPERFRDSHQRDVRQFGEDNSPARHMGRTRDVLGLRADGTLFPLDAAISQLKIGGRRLYTAILRDITERRAAESALRDSEARLRKLLEMLPDAVFVNTGNRISYVNAAAQRLFGADESALLGRPPLELIHPESAELAKARMAALHGGATVAPLTQMTILRADGSARTVESAGTLIIDGEEVSILVVLRDITEHQHTRDALAQSHAELQRLVAAQDSIQEEERKRIARELHDDLQQTLAAIKIDLAAVEQGLRRDAADVQPLLAEIDELAAAALESTRRIVNDLRPQMLEDLGLVPALEALVGQFSRRTGMTCHLEAQTLAGDSTWESPALATCLFRVAQEALGNVAKHAQASVVNLRLTAVGERIALRISDDGKGMRAGDRRKPLSFGLLGMQERVRAFGGTLQIDSRPGVGTTVEVIVPAANAAAPGRQPSVES